MGRGKFAFRGPGLTLIIFRKIGELNISGKVSSNCNRNNSNSVMEWMSDKIA